MIVKISKKDGFVRFNIQDKDGRFLGLFHISNSTDGTIIFFPENNEYCKLEITEIREEIKSYQ